jgi:hypothetical protein
MEASGLCLPEASGPCLMGPQAPASRGHQAPASRGASGPCLMEGLRPLPHGGPQAPLSPPSGPPQAPLRPSEKLAIWGSFIPLTPPPFTGRGTAFRAGSRRPVANTTLLPGPRSLCATTATPAVPLCCTCAHHQGRRAVPTKGKAFWMGFIIQYLMKKREN